MFRGKRGQDVILGWVIDYDKDIPILRKIYVLETNGNTYIEATDASSITSGPIYRGGIDFFQDETSANIALLERTKDTVRAWCDTLKELERRKLAIMKHLEVLEQRERNNAKRG